MESKMTRTISAPYMEFIETARADGTLAVALRCEQLPIDYKGRRFRYSYCVAQDGWVFATSRANGLASTRHYQFPTEAQAQIHGRTWAARKIAEARRAGCAA